MFRRYDKKIKQIMSGDWYSVDWKVLLERHNQMILDIQHERIIHLMVTIFVGLVMSVCCMATIISKEFVLALLDFPLMILFFGYLIHYRYLENTTQSWYRIRNRIRRKIKR